MKFHLIENAKVVNLLAPAADAAGRASSYISVKDYQRAFIVVHITQGNAATVALTPRQATAVAGTGAKVIGAVPVWLVESAAASDALVRQADAANLTTSAGTTNKIVVFQIDTAALDASGGFDCINVATGASNAANITAAYAILTGARYQGVTPPSAIAD